MRSRDSRHSWSQGARVARVVRLRQSPLRLMDLCEESAPSRANGSSTAWSVVACGPIGVPVWGVFFGEGSL
jgi:hypothetical protein